MKKLIIAFICFSSCNTEPKFVNHRSTWVVNKIEHCNTTIAYYRMLSTDTTVLSTCDTWVLDTIGRFEIGDTVVFSKR